jgi:hypothetical protein
VAGGHDDAIGVLKASVERDVAKWQKVVRTANIKPGS